MTDRVRLQTQGISADWSRADGSEAMIDRGVLERADLVALLERARFLGAPAPSDTGRVWSPQVVTQGDSGRFGFVMEGGEIYCHETVCTVTPAEAADLATGRRTVDEVADDPRL